VSAALRRYKIMAYLVGTGLLILVCIGVPLQYGANNKSVVAIVGPIHGFLYIIYLVSVLDLMIRARLNLKQLLVMVSAGFLPGLAFVIEHHISRVLGPRIAAEEAAHATA
jgi:integral membrane protein